MSETLLQQTQRELEIAQCEADILQLYDAEEIELAREDILAFTCRTKRDYKINWHHRLMAYKLNLFVAGIIKFLIICLPPRHGKSELTSRRLPAFIHGKIPDAKIMAASYSSDLADSMTRDVQKIMDEPSYLEIFPNTKIPGPREMDMIHRRNAQEYDILGYKDSYRGQGVGGAFTGRGARFILIDDPLKNKEEADSAVFREKLWGWYTSDLVSRLEPGGQILITSTRWHEDDLVGRVLALQKADKNAFQYEQLVLAGIREDMLMLEDPRILGDALWPSQYSVERLNAIKAGDPRQFTALYQQRPTALEGGVIKRSWLKFYTQRPHLEDFERIILSVDATFKGEPKNDFVCIQVWGKLGHKFYLLDQVRERMGFSETCKQMHFMLARYPHAKITIVEEKANGAAIIETMKADGIAGVIGVNPKDSKYSRLEACSHNFQAGDVWYPDPSIAPWISVNLDEILNFPNMAHDDTVDATSQALNFLSNKIIAVPTITAL